jgi:hypothetical protein
MFFPEQPQDGRSKAFSAFAEARPEEFFGSSASRCEAHGIVFYVLALIASFHTASPHSPLLAGPVDGENEAEIRRSFDHGP